MRRLYWRIISYYKQFWGRILTGFFILLLSVGFNLLKPWPLKYLVDNVLSHKDPNTLAVGVGLAVGAFLVIHVCSVFFTSLNQFVFVETGYRALLRLREEVYTYLQNLPMKFHESRRGGDSVYRVLYDTQSIETFLHQGFTTIIGATLTLIGTFVVMVTLNLKLTLISLGIVPILACTVVYFAKQIRKRTTTVQEKESSLLSQTSENLGAIKLIQAFVRERDSFKKFVTHAEDSLNANLALVWTQVFSGFMIGIIIAGGTGALMYYGSQEVLLGHLTVGDLLVFVAYVAMLYQPLEQLSYTAWAMEGAVGRGRRVFELLDTPDEVPEAKNAKELSVPRGEIEFKNIRFYYNEDRPVLKDISLRVEAGKTVALVGGSGTGKTTILSLLPRFYDPLNGTILIDGQEIKSVSKKSLRENISFVLQDTVLLHGTIRDNIALGKPNATEQEIIEASKLAQLDEFVQTLPKGYETQLGEHGVGLSGGQRQRVAMARAFLKDSPILILDEPTSALDLKTESELMGAFKRLMNRHTTLIVTHRIHTIHDADYIFVLNKGEIVEHGTGPQLIEKNGYYKEMWDMAQG